MSIPQQADIVIVGAGLVGATLAAAIASEPANQSCSIVLIDRGPAPVIGSDSLESEVFDPRVVALTHASVKWLKHIGAWSQIASQRVCFYEHMTIWDDEGTGEITFNAEQLRQAALGVIVENGIALQAALAVVASLDTVQVVHEQSVDAMVQQRDGHSLQSQLLTLSNGEQIAARLVIAADGAESRIRELAGLQQRRWSYHHKAIVTTVKSERSHGFTAWQNFLATGPLAFLPLGHPSEQYCSIVWSAETARAEALAELSDKDFALALQTAFESRLGQVESVAQRFSFPLIQRHAIDYIAPQVALVGDAAHTIHPLAGQGVNMGLLDAKALAAEITRAQHRQLGLDDFSILQRYQRQRKRHNLEMMLLMESFKRLFGRRDLPSRWLRNSGMKMVNTMGPIKNWLAKQAMGL